MKQVHVLSSEPPNHASSITNKQLKSSTSDIVIKGLELKKCLLIDTCMTVPAERNTYLKMKSYQSIRTWRWNSEGCGALKQKLCL